jgi:hypothetical protein
MTVEPTHPTVGVDFDKTIMQYSKGWADGSIYDPPVDGALQALAWMHRQGYRIVVFSVRAKEQAAEITTWIKEQSVKEKVYFPFTVTDVKPAAVAYIDDKAIRFVDWGQALYDLAKYAPIS